MSEKPAFKRTDFASDLDVRWCPGCGDYAILAAVQRTLPKLGVAPHQVAFVSGIGCSSRFPYYMSTYGFHTIHGRAPAIATGLKLARPDLQVWVITGDGDGLSIGGNHFVHVLRRDVDLQILLFNNRVYGLTKGQASPTSVVGQRTPSTPLGAIDPPVEPLRLALGAGARFVARVFDTSRHMPEVLEAAARHRGAALVEILQNCPVFNDGAWRSVTDRKTAEEKQLWVRHGEPLVFAGGRKGLRLRRDRVGLEVVDVGEGGVPLEEVLVHDERDAQLARLLVELREPMVFGVVHRDPAEASWEQLVARQTEQAVAERGEGDLEQLFRTGPTWRVEG